eukprot:SAG22_NODE_990_length_6131_cov_3.233588_4_plen_414_part_00
MPFPGIDRPLIAGSTPATKPSASISWPGVSLRFPTRSHGHSINDPAPNGTTGCFIVTTGTTTTAGPGLLAVHAGAGRSEPVEVDFYESVAVAFGLRPYIGGDGETATLLLAPAPEIVAAAEAPGAKPATVELELPFATPARTETWAAGDVAGGAKLLSAPEQVLTFKLDRLPATVNQDVKITITLPSGAKIIKWRRLMRAPPLAKGSFVQAVQVDHSTKSLLVDGRPFSGMCVGAPARLPLERLPLCSIGYPLTNVRVPLHVSSPARRGFYLDGVAHAHGAYHNMTEYLVKSSAPNRVNHGMVYRLSTFSPEEQLAFLDAVAAVGFKIMYDVGQQQDDCGDPKMYNLRSNATCFNDPNAAALVSLKKSIDLVKGHPAILGYYICVGAASVPPRSAIKTVHCTAFLWAAPSDAC